MGSPTPKQYLDLAGRPIIAHTLDRLCGHPLIGGVAVALGDEDGWWDGVALGEGHRPMRAAGGEERCHSVLGGLERLLEGPARPDDWVLVHDAVRPCVRADDVSRLVHEAGAHEVGGLLGIPVRDTMKRTDDSRRVTATVDRAHLWHAHTPQMFRIGELGQALRASSDAGVAVTDEAQAIERAGGRPLMVEGHPDNIKITRPEDLALAALFLAAQEAG
jgi:2-C-methyl-D-erythritol 4-phosphate cytidylyltransferase